ncbi:hypothetical protein [Xanthocytophaga flava]|uniref:hypothetical protein n=1 Tax=Xanthocytophaga flava TaxID=3048013 RepID=UPI0028D1C333|nr:hypothetical protein [Xanthocytophaga flavus]MDJ1471904.1 hypothetical protein [Xanthocytophaga flavus]
MHSYYKTSLLVTCLLIISSCKYVSDAFSENSTDTVRLVTKRILGDPAMSPKPVGPSIAKLLLIRQKTDSTLKLRYYWKYPDSTEMFFYSFNIRNDSFELVNDRSLTLVHIFEDKEDSSVKLYKYESMDSIMHINIAVILSREYGQIGSVLFPHNAARVVTHWNGKPLNKRYYNLFMNNLKQILIEEWYTEWYRQNKHKRKRRLHMMH